MRLSRAIASILLVGLLVLRAKSSHAEGESTVSLESLMEAGKRTHPSLAKQPLLAASMELQRERINRAYWPHLSLGGQATWQSEVTSIAIPIPGVNVSPPAKDQYQVTLQLQQSIWDGGVASNQKRLAETRTRVEQEKVKLDWYQVRDRILQLFIAGVVQQELKAQAELLDQYLGKVLEKSELALNDGLATRRDALLIQARQLEARQAVVDASAQLVSVRRGLEDLTATRLPLDMRLQVPAASCAAPDQQYAENSIHRPELAVLSAQADFLDAQEEVDRAGDRPRLGLFATGGYGRPGLNFLDSNFGFYFIGGVQLTVPLTYLYAGTHANGSQQLVKQRALLAKQQDVVISQVKLQLDTQDSEIDRLDQAIGLDEQLVLLREGARKQTELQLQLGTATMTDLINDLTQEDLARSKEAVHRAQRKLACYQLAFIKGDL